MRRTVRSYVLRQGRVTAAQERALAELMPAYGIGRAIREVTAEFAELSRSGGLGVTVQRRRFADDADATFQSLAGASVGS